MICLSRRARTIVAAVVCVTLASGAWASEGTAQSTCTNTNSTATATCTRSLTFSRTVGSVIKFDGGTVTFTLAAPTSADFDAGYVQSTGPTIMVYSNAPWTLKIDSPVTTWTGTASSSEPVRAAKPVGDLTWAKTANGTYTAVLANTGATLATGTATNGAVVPLYFRTALSWLLDTPGTYTVSVRFTLTSP